ncbi:glycosyl transferase, group 2 family protein [Pelodictyon luteolum DSM 273]|uniref:Glycosyl transferase, group 2 family protein n=1 Tax=Chlorobium luteolum (strain DSM 273 / BCRC 81028 / 2530) TaxID=319225 RepID=Q3B4T8_CHLL3|nr:glycosyl transferase, group 2 family protein [Pelodictyon luteolum DSM 273]
MRNLFLVTVTYGHRLNLLAQTLASAFREGVAHAIVVNNASDDPVEEHLSKQYGDWVTCVAFCSNTGSANAYKAGMAKAVEMGAEFLFLLDDDNVIGEGALSILIAGYLECAGSIAPDRLSVLACRPDHHADVLAGLGEKRANPKPGSFLGFHLADIPFKFWRRTPWFRLLAARVPMPAMMRMDIAPYSGMLFHVSVLEKHGYPDTRFVLYGDDSEFSFRITHAGGSNILITGAGLTDLETSWNLKEKKDSSFRSWLRGEGDFRVYYAARNGAYFEHFVRPHNRLERNINKKIYLFMLWLEAMRSGRVERFRLILYGIADGESARLGMNPRFIL